MTLAHGVFGMYLLVICLGAGFAVFSPNLVRALVGLIFSFMGVAGMYLLMQAPFLAFMQLLVYVGAVCVLIFFALMLARSDSEGDELGAPVPKTARALLVGVLPVGLLSPVLALHPDQSLFTPKTVGLPQLGKQLLEDFVLPFELISVILLVAMAGGVFLVWERRKR